MPYIAQKDRAKLDKVVKVAKDMGLNDLAPGEFNYLITELLIEVVGTPSYTRMSQYMNVLTDAREEYRRRVMNPYEDQKIFENGDCKYPISVFGTNVTQT